MASLLQQPAINTTTKAALTAILCCHQQHISISLRC
jgi:hypothetical protein